ncbi:hypothetical protein [Campylobacter geochelonis]|nr:hypothetical protein [Campylobacter geochelonis]
MSEKIFKVYNACMLEPNIYFYNCLIFIYAIFMDIKLRITAS